MQHASGFDNTTINPKIPLVAIGFLLAGGGLYTYLNNPSTPTLLTAILGGGALYAVWEGYV